MNSSTQNNVNLKLCDKDKLEKYSSDASINKDKSDDTKMLYTINIYLIIIYYFLLIIFAVITFSSVINSSNKGKKVGMLVLLFLYPVIIFPIQHNSYYFVKSIINYFYQDIYLSTSW
jgi:hypothetical protein